MRAPLVRQVRWRLAIATTLLALMAVATAGCSSGAGQPGAPPPLPVDVIKAQPRPVTIYDEYVAQTAAPDTIEIRSQVTGLLERQAFKDGQRVKQGELLYVIDPRPFQSALEQAKANLAQARANLANAKQTADRYKELVAEKFISKQAYDSASAQERAAAAAVDAQQALLRAAQINLGYTQIHAPSNGYISQSLVNPGGLVTKQDTLLTTLYSSDPMYVYFAISEDKLLELQRRLQHPPGERLQAAPPFNILLSDGSKYQHPGHLNFVDAAVDPKTGTLQVRVAVANPDRSLRPGMFVRVRVPAVERRAITVPQQAIIQLQDLKTVYVVGANDRPEERNITAHYREGNDWVVDSGLKPGEEVVVTGLEKLQQRPGMPIRPVLVAQDGGGNAPAPSQGEPTSTSLGPSG